MVVCWIYVHRFILCTFIYSLNWIDWIKMNWIDIFRLLIYHHETWIAHQSASTYFECGPFVLSGYSYILFTTHKGTVRKIGWSQSIYYVLRGSLAFPFLIISVDTPAPFNVVSHTRCCGSINYYLERFRPSDGIELVTLGG